MKAGVILNVHETAALLTQAKDRLFHEWQAALAASSPQTAEPPLLGDYLPLFLNVLITALEDPSHCRDAVAVLPHQLQGLAVLRVAQLVEQLGWEFKHLRLAIRRVLGTNQLMDDEAQAVLDEVINAGLNAVLFTRRDGENESMGRTRSDLLRLFNFFAQAPVGFAVYEGPEHRYVMTNARYDEIVRRQHLIGQSFATVFPQSREQGQLAIFDRVYQTGLPYEGKEFPIRYEGDGAHELRYMNFILEPFRDESGRVLGIINLVIDVTDEAKAHQTAMNQQHWLEAILNKLPTPLLMAHPETGTIYFSNEAANALYGEPIHLNQPASIYGELYHVEDLAGRRLSAAEIPIVRAAHGERLVDEEVIWLTSRGRFHVRISTDTVVGLPGHPATILLTCQDISSLKQIESALKESERRYRILTELSPQIVWMSGTDGLVFYYNQVWYDYTGLTPEESDGMGWMLAMHPDDLERSIEGGRQSRERGEAFDIEVRLKRAQDGQYRWFFAKNVPLKDADGKTLYWIGVSLDVHDRKVLADQRSYLSNALKTSEERLRLAVESTKLGIWDLDIATGELDWSDYCRDLHGLSHQDNVSLERFFHLMASEDREHARRLVAEALDPSGTGAYRLEYRVPLRGGDRWLLSVGQAFFEGEGTERKALRFAGTTIDVTKQMQAQAEIHQAKEIAEAANSAKSVFLANMSHEIRTPLGAIMGFVDLMKQADLSRQDLDTYLAIIDRNSHQLLRIIDDILDLSKIEAGKMHMECLDFSLPELLDDFASFMGFRAKENGISFEMKALTKMPEVISSDPTRLRQILANVVGNAIKFTQVGGVQLMVAFDEPYLTFTVKDTGLGISAEQAKKLFQPFAQADVSTTRKFGGTGLGLVLTKRLCEALGGDFNLETSELGKGSTFIARVQVMAPEGRPHLPASSLRHPPMISETEQLTGMRILLVEDAPDNQVLVRILLSKTGAVIDIAADGKEGVSKAMENDYDLILMDVQMPRMDGHEAVRTLRSKGYDGPIVALTAHAMKEERSRCLLSGFTDFLSKPIQRDALIETVRKYRWEQVPPP